VTDEVAHWKEAGGIASKSAYLCLWQIEIGGLSRCVAEAGQSWVTAIQLACATLQCATTGRLMGASKYIPDAADTGLEASTKGFKSVIKTTTQRREDFNNKRNEGKVQTAKINTITEGRFV
jgi:hypothetical protein